MFYLLVVRSFFIELKRAPDHNAWSEVVSYRDIRGQSCLRIMGGGGGVEVIALK